MALTDLPGRRMDRPQARVPQGPHPPRLKASSTTGPVLAGDLGAVLPQNRAERGDPDSTFTSVLCGVDRSANARVAREQAQLLVSPAGRLELVNAAQLTRHGPRALRDLAGRLAAVHGGTVTILAAPPQDPTLQRAIAASARVLLGPTGAAPRLLSEQLPPERAIPSAALTLGATLVVVSSADNETARRMTAQVGARLACSVLVVPIGRSRVWGRAKR
jgi:hypothetical protein